MPLNKMVKNKTVDVLWVAMSEKMIQNYVPFILNLCVCLEEMLWGVVVSSAGLMREHDGCIHVPCDDIVPVFTAGWCPGMLHSSGDTNQASIVSSSVIAVFWHPAPLSRWDAGNTTSAVSK